MMRQGARRKNILYGSVTDEQRRRSGKDRQPFGLSSGGRLAALLLSHRTLRLCSFVAALPAALQSLAHPFLFVRWVLMRCGHALRVRRNLESFDLFLDLVRKRGRARAVYDAMIERKREGDHFRSFVFLS